MPLTFIDENDLDNIAERNIDDVGTLTEGGVAVGECLVIAECVLVNVVVLRE